MRSVIDLAETFSERYALFCYKLVGQWVEEYLVESFRDLQVDLKKSMIRMSLPEYLSAAVVTAIGVFIFQTILLSFIFGILTRKVLVSILGGFLGGVLSAVGIFMLFYVYPPTMVGERKKKIDDALPFATLYLATMAGTGTPLVSMFRMLSKFREYGEVSTEAKRIVDAVDITGAPITQALETIAEKTPSDSFRELLWGVRSTIEVGGDLKSYLHERAMGLMQEYRRRLLSFTNQLVTFLEIYINAVIIGSLFFLVLTSILGTMGTEPKTIITIHVLLVFFLLPMASFGFIIMLKGIQPTTEG